MASPDGLAVLHLLRSRVPALRWDPRRVVLAVQDYETTLDTVEVAGKCADWLMSGQATKVKDGPGTYRAFLERAKAAKDREVADAAASAALRAYDRFSGSG